MAARPLGVLVAIDRSRTMARSACRRLADGIGDAVDVAGTTIRGGNLSDGSASSRSRRRCSARRSRRSVAAVRAPGDHVYVTGRLGGPAAALRLFSQRDVAGRLPRALRASGAANRRGAVARRARRVRGDRHLRRSRRRCSDISPRRAASESRSTRRVFRDSPASRSTIALASGEEYELVVTSPPSSTSTSSSGDSRCRSRELGRSTSAREPVAWSFTARASMARAATITFRR